MEDFHQTDTLTFIRAELYVPMYSSLGGAHI